MNRSTKNSKIKNSKIKYIILALILVILGLIGVSTYYINLKINKVEKVEINRENLSINEKQVKEENHIKNIALFGIDAPKEKVGRSDAIMILTLDEEHKVMKLTSIMRDSYVDIP